MPRKSINAPIPTTHVFALEHPEEAPASYLGRGARAWTLDGREVIVGDRAAGSSSLFHVTYVATQENGIEHGGELLPSPPDLGVETEQPGDDQSEPYDSVNTVPHYRGFSNGSEVIDIVEHLGFNLGNAVKYLARAGRKPGTEADTDLRKALRYIQRELSLRQGVEDAPKIADGSNTIVVGWGEER